MISYLRKNHLATLLLLVFGALFLLRIINLGYSDYSTDEATVLGYLRSNSQVFSTDYLLQQRKGPLQWLVVLLPYFILKDVYHEFAFRLPFAIFNIFALYFFFKFVEKETKNFSLALMSTFLLGVNGFIVAFGRFVQYQSLNLFFSSLSLYFFARFLHEDKNKFFYFGTATFSLSLLAHWDAVFIVPYLIYVIMKKFDLKMILVSVFLGLMLVGPFLIPFLRDLRSNERNRDYFSSRLGLKEEISLQEVRFKTSVYNPFLFIGFTVLLLFVAVPFARQYYIFWFWFLSVFAAFLLFIKVPGTHTYNILLPVTVLVSSGYRELSRYFKNGYKLLPIGVIIAVLCFFYYQTYILFVNVDKEYPWEQEKIFRYLTPEYDHGDLTNHIIGFTHGRKWSEARIFIEEYLNNQDPKEKYTYITNENKTIANFYIDLDYGESNRMLALGVKNPYNFAQDYKFSYISGRKTLHNIKNAHGDTLIRIYEIIRE